MKRIVLLSLLALSLPGLSACSKKDDAPPPEAKTVAAPVEDSWPGKYEGDVMARISPDHKVVLISAKSDGCTGDIGLGSGGIAAAQYDGPDTLNVDINMHDHATCSIALKRSGDTLQISETEECAEFHGATCPFNGTATRVK